MGWWGEQDDNVCKALSIKLIGSEDENVSSPLYTLNPFISAACIKLNQLYSHVQSMFGSICIDSAPHDNTARRYYPHFKGEETKAPLILHSWETAELSGQC